MGVKATISSRDFTSLFWSRNENNFDLGCDFRFDEKTGEVNCLHKVPANFAGAPGKVHGGILAALMDEAQGALCYHLGYFVMTDQLNMNYRKATSLEQTIRIRAWLTAARRKKIYSQASIEDEKGEILVTSHARWYIFPLKILNRAKPGEYPPEDWKRMEEIMHANRSRGKKIRLKLRKEHSGKKEGEIPRS